MVLEYVFVRLNEGIDKSEYIQLAKLVDKEFISKQPGFINHTSWWADDGSWVDSIEWESMEHAKTASEKALQSNTCTRWFSMMNMDEMIIEYLNQAVIY